MCDVTRILSQIESGNPAAAEQLLPLVYEELRKLAAEKMAQEKPGQTLQATALVHEAYIRLVDVENAQHWDSRGRFFSATAEAMRRTLVENARRKQATNLAVVGNLNKCAKKPAASAHWRARLSTNKFSSDCCEEFPFSGRVASRLGGWGWRECNSPE